MRSDRTHTRTRWKTTAVTFTLMLAFAGGLTTAAFAQIPTTAVLYGVHETQVSHPSPFLTGFNPFRDTVQPNDGPTLHVIYQRPNGTQVPFWGFYDGNGAGGMDGTVWKIRFMPDQVGSWYVWWWFSDGHSSGSGPFTTSNSDIPGPPRLDPANNKFLTDARGNPIHWRGYGVKHGAKALDAPPYGAGLQLQPVLDFEQNVITTGLIGGGYNAAYVTVPTGWRTANMQSPDYQLNGTCNPLGTQLDCPLWGDYNYYSLRAMHVFDHILNHLHQNRIWTIGWITFGLQQNWATLKNAAVYEPLMKYFVARYGAYYNYFMWSPTWETFDMIGYVDDVTAMMTHLNSTDPGYLDTGGTHRKRPQGVHDEVQVAWAGWQTVQPRQHPCQTRTIFDGNSRKIGIYNVPTTGLSGPPCPNGSPSRPTPLGADYPYVIFGAETLWEFCNGAFGKPTNGTEVRRGLFGELFAGVLPIYDEWFEDAAHGPCDPDGPGPLNGLGNGQGDGIVQGTLNWWYSTVNYRHPQFQILNLPGCGSVQICSGILGQEYVLTRQGPGNLSLDLSAYSGTMFKYTVINLDTGGMSSGTIPAGPFSVFYGNDTLVHMRRQ